jgi:hypothetical protein
MPVLSNTERRNNTQVYKFFVNQVGIIMRMTDCTVAYFVHESISCFTWCCVNSCQKLIEIIRMSFNLICLNSDFKDVIEHLSPFGTFYFISI